MNPQFKAHDFGSARRFIPVKLPVMDAPALNNSNDNAAPVNRWELHLHDHRLVDMVQRNTIESGFHPDFEPAPSAALWKLYAARALITARTGRRLGQPDALISYSMNQAAMFRRLAFTFSA